MLQQSITLPPSPDYPLYITAKRYWLQQFDAHAAHPRARTLLVLHSTSFHKETWEPSLHHLFELAAERRGPIIREAWAVECPNHGESVLLNEKAFSEPEHATSFSCEGYAIAVHRFLSSGLVDFTNRNLVGIGHSLGANAMLLLQHMIPIIPFSALIIVEPLLNPAGGDALTPLREWLVTSAQRRRDTWTSRSEALRILRTRPATKKWDLRVLQAFVNHAIRQKDDGQFGLACTKEQEVMMYRDEAGPITPMHDLDEVCHVLPVHLILGTIKDFIPERVHEVLVDPKSGRIYRSITMIEDTGHLIPQEKPKELGTAIYNILSGKKSMPPTPRL